MINLDGLYVVEEDGKPFSTAYVRGELRWGPLGKTAMIEVHALVRDLVPEDEEGEEEDEEKWHVLEHPAELTISAQAIVSVQEVIGDVE